MDEHYHTPVLVEEVARTLLSDPAGVYVDGTLGGGGHAEALLMMLSPGGRVIGLDVDEEALAAARRRLERFGDRIRCVRESYAALPAVLQSLAIERIDGLLLDLGLSSRQIDDPERGFSFQSDARLDMRMDRRKEFSAWDVVNTYDEKNLSRVLSMYGEERRAGAIARRVVRLREKGRIDTTSRLSEIVESVVGRRFLRNSLARVFQAIRIEVNGELEELRTGLRNAVGLIRRGGRLVVISYHSLEDRIVKEFFREETQRVVRSGNKLLPDAPRQARLAILTGKPVMAGPAEAALNPRSRSAKLRAAERI